MPVVRRLTSIARTKPAVDNATVNNWILSTSVGITLVALGVVLLRSHRRTWRRQQNDASLEDSERIHFHKRFRRRMQASGLIALLGVLIPLGDLALPVLLPQQQFPAVFAVFWPAVLLLTLWVIVLAFADMLATSAHARIALNRVQRKQRELHQQIAEIKRRSGQGRDASSDDAR